MVNMLIAHTDMLKLKKLVNEVTTNKDIRIAKITTEGEETLKVFNQEEIDVALIEADLLAIPEIDILKELEKKGKEKYRHSVIVVTEEFEKIKKIIKNEIIYDYVLENTEYKEMMLKIEKMIKEKDIKENRKRIIKELKYIGYNLEYVGTTYIIETILQMYIHRELMLDNLQQDIYPIVSKIYNKSVHNIKCNINRATECMYYECDINRLKKYFSFYDDIKPTAKTVMYTVLNKISS